MMREWNIDVKNLPDLFNKNISVNMTINGTSEFNSTGTAEISPNPNCGYDADNKYYCISLGNITVDGTKEVKVYENITDTISVSTERDVNQSLFKGEGYQELSLTVNSTTTFDEIIFVPYTVNTSYVNVTIVNQTQRVFSGVGVAVYNVTLAIHPNCSDVPVRYIGKVGVLLVNNGSYSEYEISNYTSGYSTGLGNWNISALSPAMWSSKEDKITKLVHLAQHENFTSKGGNWTKVEGNDNITVISTEQSLNFTVAPLSLSDGTLNLKVYKSTGSSYSTKNFDMNKGDMVYWSGLVVEYVDYFENPDAVYLSIYTSFNSTVIPPPKFARVSISKTTNSSVIFKGDKVNVDITVKNYENEKLNVKVSDAIPDCFYVVDYGDFDNNLSKTITLNANVTKELRYTMASKENCRGMWVYTVPMANATYTFENVTLKTQTEETGIHVRSGKPYIYICTSSDTSCGATRNFNEEYTGEMSVGEEVSVGQYEVKLEDVAISEDRAYIGVYTEGSSGKMVAVKKGVVGHLTEVGDNVKNFSLEYDNILVTFNSADYNDKKADITVSMADDYERGDNVEFSVWILNDAGLSLDDGTLSFSIYDPDEEKVPENCTTTEEFSDEESTATIDDKECLQYTTSYSLCEDAKLGEYYLKADYDSNIDSTAKYEFKVCSNGLCYVLPPMEETEYVSTEIGTVYPKYDIVISNYPEEIEAYQGEEVRFKVTAENREENIVVDNLELAVTGRSSWSIEVEPFKSGKVSPGDVINYDVLIVIPEDETTGEYDVTLNLKVGSMVYDTKSFVLRVVKKQEEVKVESITMQELLKKIEYVENVIRETENMLKNAEAEGKDVSEAEKTLEEAKELLKNANMQYQLANYDEGYTLADEALKKAFDAQSQIKKAPLIEKFKQMRTIELLKNEIAKLRVKYRGIAEVQSILDRAEEKLKIAEKSFEKGEYKKVEGITTQIYNMLNQAQTIGENAKRPPIYGIGLLFGALIVVIVLYLLKYKYGRF